MKLIIFEGLDRCFKTTNVNEIKNSFINVGKPVHVLHYSSIKSINVKKSSEELYRNLFQMYVALKDVDGVLICDRAHLGEWVYGKIYRDYDANFIWGIEKEFINYSDDVSLVVLYDSDINSLLKREDGLSYSSEYSQKQMEIDRFRYAFKRSNIPNKMLFNVNGQKYEDIFSSIWSFVNFNEKR